MTGEGGASGFEGAGPGDDGVFLGGEEKLETGGAARGQIERDLEGGGGVAAEVGLLVAGVALDGENYLLPVDAPRPDKVDKEGLKLETFALMPLIERIRSTGSNVQIAIII